MPTFDDATIERLFGAEDAESENEERFKQYFVFNKAYHNLIQDLPIRIVVGHKGVGKSAILKRAYIHDRERNSLALFLQPNDIEGIWDPKDKSINELIEAWKTGIESIVQAKAIEAFTGASGAAASAAPGTTSGRLFERIRSYASKLLQEKAPNISSELAEAFVQQKRIVVYMDDMDRGWEASQTSIKNMSALLNAIRDMSNKEPNIFFRIGLRSDVYFLVRTSDESTDKIERHVIWLDWTNHDILCVAANRITTFFNMELSQEQIIKMEQGQITKQILARVIGPVYDVGRGHWANRPIHNVLLSLCRRRPRDLIKLFHGAARVAFREKSDLIRARHLEQTFSRYSEERLQDIINEFKSELPDIASLVLNMRPTKKELKASQSYRFSTDSILKKLHEIVGRTSLRFKNGRQVTQKSLLHFLYKIDFVTARKEVNGRVERYYFDQSRFLANEAVDFGFDWEVHPAYRWALQPSDIQEVIDSLD
ncbi:MAG TPA: hypothetical protein PL096_08685 [Micropepsaceae bacterium]|nr:hypothetical protein [Micropepsaceae bacterium]